LYTTQFIVAIHREISHSSIMKTTMFIASATAIFGVPPARAQLRGLGAFRDPKTVEGRVLFHKEGHDDFDHADVHHADEHHAEVQAVVFDECIGKTFNECYNLIRVAVTNHQEDFDHAWDEMPVLLSRVNEEPRDEGYQNVGMRTDRAETHVVGVLGDGMVFYPRDWCPIDGSECAPIGPWDCNVGGALTVEDCCDLIMADVPGPDIHGNYLTCVAVPPVGSASNPYNGARVSIHIDSDMIVRHAPRVE